MSPAAMTEPPPYEQAASLSACYPGLFCASRFFDGCYL